MAERKIKIRTRSQDGKVEVLALVTHPMETGQRTDAKTKQKIPAHFIQRIALEHNGKLVAEVQSGPAVSADPLLGFQLKNAKNGDKIRLSWTDNKGESASQEAVVEL
jgi:sulfur-oxidizing protein SoxZ